MKRLPNDASMFTRKVRAILLALDMAEQAKRGKWLVMSDSLSLLQGVENRLYKNPLIHEATTGVHNLVSSGHQVVFMWRLSHVGLEGNVAVDAAAKASLALQPATSPPIPRTSNRPSTLMV